jgi:hypothetical protein
VPDPLLVVDDLAVAYDGAVQALRVLTTFEGPSAQSYTVG